jgi:hypothetical protein
VTIAVGKGDSWDEAAREAKRAVAAVRDDPQGRLQLLDRAYGSEEEWCRAERAFMEWEVRRGVLNPPGHTPPGSGWWRAVNERLLRDVEAARLLDSWGTEPASGHGPVAWWLSFFQNPGPQAWYRAHNASVIAGYLTAAPLALHETDHEQKLMNLILMRVLYAHLMEEHGPLHPGPLSHIGRLFADPRSFGIGRIVKVPSFYPPHYPLDDSDGRQEAQHQHRWARSLFLMLIDEDMVIPRLEKLYWFVAELLALPRLVHLAIRGMPSYPWGALVPASEIERLTLTVTPASALLAELRRLALGRSAARHQ